MTITNGTFLYLALQSNYLAITVGDRTQKQKQRSPLLRAGLKQGIHQPPLVSDFFLSDQNKTTCLSTVSDTLRPYQPWFPIILGMLEDYPHQLPHTQVDIILNPINQEFIMKQGVPM